MLVLFDNGTPRSLARYLIDHHAVERGSDVATFNKRHFSQVRGLKIIEPQ